MKLIKTDKAKEREIQVGDIVKVIAEGQYGDVPEGVVGVVHDYDFADGKFEVYAANDYDYFSTSDLELVMKADGTQIDSEKEDIFDIQLTKSELQGIVSGIGCTTKREREVSANFNGYPEKVAAIAHDIYNEIREILQEAK